MSNMAGNVVDNVSDKESGKDLAAYTPPEEGEIAQGRSFVCLAGGVITSYFHGVVPNHT